MCQTSSLSLKLCHCEGPTCVETAPTCGIWGRRRTAFTMFWGGSVILLVFFQLWGPKNPFFGSDNCHVSRWQWWRLSTWCMFGTEPFIFCMLLLALNILARFPWISLSLLLSNRTKPIPNLIDPQHSLQSRHGVDGTLGSPGEIKNIRSRIMGSPGVRCRCLCF